MRKAAMTGRREDVVGEAELGHMPQPLKLRCVDQTFLKRCQPDASVNRILDGDSTCKWTGEIAHWGCRLMAAVRDPTSSPRRQLVSHHASCTESYLQPRPLVAGRPA